MTKTFPLNQEAVIPLIVETYASDSAIAATLNQTGHLFAFFSYILTPMKCKYTSVEKEAFAIIKAVKKWSHYLLGQKFTIITD